MLSLRPANCNDIEKEYLFVRDIPADENGYINDYPDISREDFDSALDCLIANSSGEQLPDGYVPATTYFLWDNNDIVGEFQLRHHLCESLISGAGHIGYYISPENRGKGYATEGLKLILLHRVNFREVEYLRKFCEIMLSHDYQINADEKKMIVDTFKMHTNEDGLILNDIFSVANQARLLCGDYEGYRVLTKEDF